MRSSRKKTSYHKNINTYSTSISKVRNMDIHITICHASQRACIILSLTPLNYGHTPSHTLKHTHKSPHITPQYPTKTHAHTTNRHARKGARVWLTETARTHTHAHNQINKKKPHTQHTQLTGLIGESAYAACLTHWDCTLTLTRTIKSIKQTHIQHTQLTGLIGESAYAACLMLQRGLAPLNGLIEIAHIVDINVPPCTEKT